MVAVCRLGNHIATFEYASYGVCGAMVCSWIRAGRSGVRISRKEDFVSVGSLVLAQGAVIRAANENTGRNMLFRRFGLNVRHSFTHHAIGGRSFTGDRMARRALAPGYSYISISWYDEDEDEGKSHAIGTYADPLGSIWRICDPNFFLWEFPTAQTFVISLSGLLSERGLPPDVDSGPYPAVSGRIFHVC